MGHRALYVYELHDGTVRACYSHHGSLNLGTEMDVGPTNVPGGRTRQSQDVLVKAINDYYAAGGRDESEPPEYPGEDFEDECSAARSVADACHTKLDFVMHEALFVVRADWSVEQFGTLSPMFYPEDHLDRPATPGTFGRGKGLLYAVYPDQVDEEHPSHSDVLAPVYDALWEQKAEARAAVEDGTLSWMEGVRRVARWLRTTDLVDPERAPSFSPIQPDCHYESDAPPE